MPKRAEQSRNHAPEWVLDEGRDFSAPDDLTAAQYTAMLRRAVRTAAKTMYEHNNGREDALTSLLFNAYIGGLPIPQREGERPC